MPGPLLAGVTGDLEAGLSLQQASRAALDAGHAPTDVVMQLMNAGVDPFTATEAVVAISPESAESIVENMVLRQPEASGAIVLGAMNILPGEAEDVIVQAAIAGGADPTDVASATAAGGSPASGISRDILADLDAGRSLPETARNALDAGHATDQVLRELMAAGADPFSTTQAVVSVAPERAVGIVETMVSYTPENSGAVVLAVLDHVPSQARDEVIQAAILAGADPTDITAATAAGRPSN